MSNPKILDNRFDEPEDELEEFRLLGDEIRVLSDADGSPNRNKSGIDDDPTGNGWEAEWDLSYQRLSTDSADAFARQLATEIQRFRDKQAETE